MVSATAESRPHRLTAVPREESRVTVELDAVLIVAISAVVLAAVIAYETVRFAELRDRLRHQLAHE